MDKPTETLETLAERVVDAIGEMESLGIPSPWDDFIPSLVLDLMEVVTGKLVVPNDLGGEIGELMARFAFYREERAAFDAAMADNSDPQDS